MPAAAVRDYHACHLEGAECMLTCMVLEGGGMPCMVLEGRDIMHVGLRGAAQCHVCRFGGWRACY